MQEQHSRLQHFPIPLFATIMGLGGFTIAVEKAEATLGLPVHISPVLFYLSAALFVFIAAMYTAKFAKHRQAVAKEFNNPIRLNFFPAITIGLLLLSIASLELHPGLSKALWMIGAIGQLALTLYIMSQWIHQNHFEIHHSNPAWFIPVVGNIIVPIAGVAHAPAEASWFYFSFGLFFWVILQTIILNRVIFHHQAIQPKLLPTLFIMIAPPAVGFISYLKLGGELDTFARVLYYTGLFITLLLFVQLRHFTKLQFFLSWWAYSFPIAAITIATMLMYELSGAAWFKTLSWTLLTILTLLIAILVIRTLQAAFKGQICVPE